MIANLSNRIAVGAVWMIALRQADRLIGLISITILARLLLPEDFGLVVYATTFIAMLELFFQFGFETVLIRDQGASRESYDTAWTLEIIKGISLCLLMVAGAKPMAAFFEEPAVEAVVYYLSAMPLLNGLKNIGIVDFQKKMEFNKEFIYMFSVRIVSTIATIIMAFQLRTHWALVYGMLVNSTLGCAFSYVMSPYRPWFSLAKVSRIFGFSKWLLVQNLMLGINNRISVLVLGRLFEPRVAAIYNMGLELSNMASAEFAAPIRRVLFPGIASVSDDERRMVDTIVNVIGMIALVGLPMTIGIAVTAPFFVPLLLGNNWAEVVPIIQVLAVNGVCLVIYSNSHIIFYALDKPHLTAVVTGYRMLLLIPAVILLVPEYGAIGAAWALSLVNVIVTICEYIMFYRLVDVQARSIFGAIWRSVLSVFVMGAAVHWIVQWLLRMPSRLPLAGELAISVGAGVVVYVSFACVLWLLAGRPEGAEAYILRKMKGTRSAALVA